MTAKLADTQIGIDAAFARLEEMLRTLEALSAQQATIFGSGDPAAIDRLVQQRASLVTEIDSAGSELAPRVAAHPAMRERWNVLADLAANIRSSDSRDIEALRLARDGVIKEIGTLSASKLAHGAYATGASPTPKLEDREA